MNILLIGNGKMSKTIKMYFKNTEYKIIDALDDKHKKYKKDLPIDLVIDFSSPSGLNTSLYYSLLYKVPLIIGTTGYNLENKKRIENASKKIPIFFESNFSLVLYEFKKIKEYLSNLDIQKNEYIIETHHKFKKDSPSGTALSLNLKKAPIFSLRGGSVFGEHEVRYIFDYEEIIITHVAHNRFAFMDGLKLAINFIITQVNGIYNLNNIKGDKNG